MLENLNGKEILEEFKNEIKYRWEAEGNPVGVDLVRFENCPEVAWEMRRDLGEYVLCEWAASYVELDGWSTRDFSVQWLALLLRFIRV